MKNVRRFIALAASSLLLASSSALAYDQEILFRDLPREMDVISFRDAVFADVAEIPDPSTFSGEYALKESLAETATISYFDPDSPRFASEFTYSGDEYIFYKGRIAASEQQSIAGYYGYNVRYTAIPTIENDHVSTDPRKSCILNAAYALFFEPDKPGNEIALDLLAKLSNLYGDYDHVSATETSNTYVWLGRNETYLRFHHMNYGEDMGNSFTIEYGLSDSKERIEELNFQPTFKIDFSDIRGL